MDQEFKKQKNTSIILLVIGAIALIIGIIMTAFMVIPVELPAEEGANNANTPPVSGPPISLVFGSDNVAQFNAYG